MSNPNWDGGGRQGLDAARTWKRDHASEHFAAFARWPSTQHDVAMTPGAAKQSELQEWKPHPDDDADVGAALHDAERGDLLSPEASNAFLCWLEGSDDDSWRVEFE